jgi:hypothetical protein
VHASATDVVWHVSEEPPVNLGLGRENLRQVSHLHRDSVRGWSPGSMSWLRSPTFLASVVIAVVTLVLRLAYAATGPTNADGAELVIGSGRFDVTHSAPRAPGSWLYVTAGHAIHVVTGLSAVHSLVLLAALASAGAAALTCVAGTALGGRFVGIASAALVGSAPVSWFAGSTVSTYGFDTVVGALLVVLARRARPHRAHGVVAVVVLMLGAGVRLSIVPAFALLAAIAAVASVRTVGQLLATVAGGLGALAVWFVPVIVIQPGGVHTWLHAVHLQISDTAHSSSVFVAPTSGAITNIGTFGAWSLVSLGPVVVVGVLGVVALTGARMVTRHPAGNVALRIWGTQNEPTDRIERPWYQRTGALLAAAIVPPVALVTVGHFAGGGDVLWYLAPVTVLMLLPVARLLHHRAAGVRHVAGVVATLLVAGTIAVNVQRFVAAAGILPASVAHDHPGLWISQSRYQAPYADTADAIGAADRTDASLGRLRSVANAATDVIVCVSSQNGAAVYRILGAELPGFRVALVHPFRFMELDGRLVHQHAATLSVGHAVFLVTSTSPALAALASSGQAEKTTTHVAGFEVWRVKPGATLFGVAITAGTGPGSL